LILKFGGHAAAAGLTLPRARFDEFAALFEAVARNSLSEADLTRVIETDGLLQPTDISLDNASLLRETVWGQGFPAPQFNGEFNVQSQRVVGEKHLKLRLATGGQAFDAILFNQAEPLPERIHAVYRLDVNEWNGRRSVQLAIEAIEAIEH
jgi:single-stranded-DNA-specific exonuclease